VSDSGGANAVRVAAGLLVSNEAATATSNPLIRPIVGDAGGKVFPTGTAAA
jgi:hypothetical protein